MDRLVRSGKLSRKWIKLMAWQQKGVLCVALAQLGVGALYSW
jgi:hypothetical protein